MRTDQTFAVVGFESGQVARVVSWSIKGRKVCVKCARGVGCERNEARMGRRNARGVVSELGFLSLSPNQSFQLTHIDRI